MGGADGQSLPVAERLRLPVGRVNVSSNRAQVDRWVEIPFVDDGAGGALLKAFALEFRVDVAAFQRSISPCIRVK